MSFTRYRVEQHMSEYGEVDRMTGISLSSSSTSITSGYENAIYQVRKIQGRFTKRLLCGSLALILYGVIKKRKIHDLDFIVYEKNVVSDEYISLVVDDPYKHCLFLASYTKEGDMIEGIKLQDLDQIIQWKLKLGREKDRKDLEGYMKSQYFKEEEFLIDL